MAMKGKGKQAVAKIPASAAASSSSGKRKAAEPARSGRGCGVKRLARRPGVLQFFDDAAVEADSDCEKEEDLVTGEAEHEALDDNKLEDENLRGVGKSHQLPFFIKEEELSGDELEELIKERYTSGSGYVRFNDGFTEGDKEILKADELNDAMIWKVKCMVGRERQVAFCLMQKYIEMHNLGTKMQIISAFSIEHVKGHFFVEADKLTDIVEACKGFCSVYSSRISLVPRNEIPNLLAFRNKLSEVSTGAWVRMRSGNYKGDLAKVVAVDDGHRRVTIKLVPRIDLQAIAQKFGGGVSLKLAAVPTPRLISPRELEIFRPHIELRCDRQTGELFQVLNGTMLKDGYLYKKVSIASLIFWGVQPSNSELLMFSDATKDVDEDLNWVSSIYNARNKNPSTEPLKDKVSAGRKDGYGLHDLVLFGRKNFGVIVAIEKDCFKILRGDIEGAEVLPVKIRDVKSACDDRMFTALDSKGKSIFIDDTVRTSVGPSEGREGSVKHMYKGTLFIEVENETENCEFFCAKSKSCEKTNESKGYHGAKSGKGKGEGCSSFLQSPTRMDDQQNENENACGSTRNRRCDYEQTFSIGQTLRIREGPLKGYLCRVVGIYHSDITVKLDSLVKLITVKEKSLAVPKLKGDSSFATRSSDHFAQGILSAAGTSFGEASEKRPWESVVPSFNRDSWEPFSSSNSAGWNHGNQTGHHDDPWTNKTGSAAKTDAGSDNALDDWGKQPASSTGHEADPWGKTAGLSSDHWSKKSRDEKTTGGVEWEKKSNDWSKRSYDEKSTGGYERGINSNDWSKKSCDEKTTEGDERGKSSNDWSKKSCDEKSTGGDEGEKRSNDWSKRSGDGGDERGINSNDWSKKYCDEKTTEGDEWGKSSNDWSKHSCDEKSTGGDEWEKKSNDWSKRSCHEKSTGGDERGINSNDWSKKYCDEKTTEGDEWGKSSNDWSKKSCDEKSTGGDECENSKLPVSNAGGSWDMGSDKNDNPNSWDRKGEDKLHSKDDPWSKAAGWTAPNNSWGNKGKEKVSSEEDSSWHKGRGSERVTSNDQIDDGKKPNYSEGAHNANTQNENWSQGGGWNKNQDMGQPSWKKDKEQEDEDGETNTGYNWSRNRDVDGDRGSCWGRGNMGFGAGEEEERWSSEARDRTIKGDWDKSQPDEPQNNSNAWEIMGKRTVAEDDCWGKATDSQETATGKADNWGDNGQAGSWGKASSAGSGGWNQGKSWDKPKPSEDSSSDWNKIWNRATGFRGRGQGWNNQNYHNGGCSKPMDHGEGRSSWGRGRGGNDIVGGDQGSQCNWQSDFVRGRQSGWQGGRGQYRSRERNQGDNSGGPPNREGGWRGRGRGQGPGRGKFFSSGRRNGDRENSGEGSFQRNSTSTWGTDDNKGWSSSWSKDNAAESDGGMQPSWNN